MSGLTLTWFAVAILVGALLGVPLSLEAHATVLCSACIVAVAFVRTEPPPIRLSLLLALVLSLGYTIYRTESEPKIHETRTQHFAGVVTDERSSDSGFHEYQVKLDRSYTVLAACETQVTVGSRVVIRGRLEPFDDARNPGEPSQREIERENGITARIANATILSQQSVRNDFAAAVARAKGWALQQLRLRLGDSAAAIVAGELWGERAAMAPDLRNEFQETGTVHVLVTAGLHVSLVAAAVVLALATLGAPRVVSCVTAIACVWAFAALSGLHIPALRAATMTTMAFSARAVGRATLSWNSLAAALIVVIAVAPLDVASASFWLSFCCVAGIFALLPTLERFFMHFAHAPQLREALFLTIATQLATWPITAAVFLQFSTYGIVANLAVVPCVPITMSLGALQLLLSWCAPLAQAFANINGWVLAWTIGAVRLLSSAPGASIVMTPAPVWAIALYEAALAGAVVVIRQGGVTCAVALLATATSYVLWPPSFPQRLLRITVLDVGQADAIVIETPAHHAILVDAGGRLERGTLGAGSAAEQVGERIVVPFLIRQGIHQLDALIISHPHGDHVGGCSPILRKLRVAEVADSGQTYGGHAYRDCIVTAAAKSVPIVQPRAGIVWSTNDGVTLTFIGPSLPFIGGRNAINDNSIAFVLQYRSFRMLFTGDAGVAAEQKFLREGVYLQAQVLKVGHHGSAYSSSPAFISATRPRYAIVSVGRNNLFGHPAPSTIETLQHFGAHVYRTDEIGATMISTDGQWVAIYSML